MVFRFHKKQHKQEESGTSPSATATPEHKDKKHATFSPWAGVPVVLKQKYEGNSEPLSVQETTSLNSMTTTDRSKMSWKSARSLQSIKCQKSMASLRNSHQKSNSFSFAGAPVILKDDDKEEKHFSAILGKEPKTVPKVTVASPWAGVPVMLHTDNERLQKEQQLKEKEHRSTHSNDNNFEYPKTVNVNNKELFAQYGRPHVTAA